MLARGFLHAIEDLYRVNRFIDGRASLRFLSSNVYREEILKLRSVQLQRIL